MQATDGVRRGSFHPVLMVFLLTALPFLEAGLVVAFIPQNPSFLFRDYYLQTFLATLLLFQVILEHSEIETGIQKRTLTWNLFSLGLLFLLALYRASLEAKLGDTLFLFLFSAASLGLLMTSPFVFLKLSFYRAVLRNFSLEGFFVVLGAVSQGLYQILNERCWVYLAWPTTRLVTSILKLFGYPMIEAPVWNMIEHPVFRVRIAPVCDGLEGVSFFVFVASILAILDCRRFSKKFLIGFFVSGILFFLLLNVLRITVFFAFAVWMTERWGRGEASQWMVWAFHSHVGWIFYVLGTVLFFAAFYAIFKSKRNQAPPSRHLKSDTVL